MKFLTTIVEYAQFGLYLSCFSVIVVIPLALLMRVFLPSIAGRSKDIRWRMWLITAYIPLSALIFWLLDPMSEYVTMSETQGQLFDIFIVFTVLVIMLNIEWHRQLIASNKKVYLPLLLNVAAALFYGFFLLESCAIWFSSH